jgi:hypothetical protein
MPGGSSFSLTGMASFVSARREQNIGLSTAVGSLDVGGSETLVPAGATKSIPLNFSGDVDEAVILHLYSPKKILVAITDSFGDAASLGLKGHSLLTMYPGAGVSTLSATNPSTTENVTISVSYGAKQMQSDPDPEYWKD